MNEEQFNNMVKEMKAKGLEESDIMNILLETTVQGKASIEDLALMAGWLGYTIKEDKVREIVERERKERNIVIK